MTHEVVYLLHGLGRSCWSMASMGKHLRQSGFQVRPWRYYSTRHQAEHHPPLLADELSRADHDPSISSIHFVTHSMGGIIVRAALNLGVPSKMGRVVMLAPPNCGSNVARTLGPWLAWLWKPLPQLSCAPDSYVCTLPVPAGIQFGIIAGARDNKVRVEHTHLPGENDHLIVPGGHTFIMNRRDVCRQTACFLREGRFARPPAAELLHRA
jgi:hypothetical protein